MKSKQQLVVGVTSVNNLADWIYDEIDNGIDLSYEQAEQDAREEAISELGNNADEFDIDELVEQKMEFYECDGDSRQVLIGDWTKDAQGRWNINKQGSHGFAAVYSGFCGGTITVEWSKFTKMCAQTSPCFMMASGGTCGDLDTKGKEKRAYSLPKDYFVKKHAS